jgi:hypothetical protein
MRCSMVHFYCFHILHEMFHGVVFFISFTYYVISLLILFKMSLIML